jgi:hypothetical protein
MMLNNELEKPYKEMVVAYFRVIFLYSHGETKAFKKNPSRYSRCPGRGLNWHLPNTSQKRYSPRQFLRLFALL